MDAALERIQYLLVEMEELVHQGKKDDEDNDEFENANDNEYEDEDEDQAENKEKIIELYYHISREFQELEIQGLYNSQDTRMHRKFKDRFAQACEDAEIYEDDDDATREMMFPNGD